MIPASGASRVRISDREPGTGNRSGVGRLSIGVRRLGTAVLAWRGVLVDTARQPNHSCCRSAHPFPRADYPFTLAIVSKSRS